MTVVWSAVLNLRHGFQLPGELVNTQIAGSTNLAGLEGAPILCISNRLSRVADAIGLNTTH